MIDFVEKKAHKNGLVTLLVAKDDTETFSNKRENLLIKSKTMRGVFTLIALLIVSITVLSLVQNSEPHIRSIFSIGLIVLNFTLPIIIIMGWNKIPLEKLGCDSFTLTLNESSQLNENDLREIYYNHVENGNNREETERTINMIIQKKANKNLNK